MTYILKKIELLANISIIVVAILLSTILVKSYLWKSNLPPGNSRTATASQPQIEIGKEINLPDVDWRKNGKTLLLALSTTCHFCTESGPFYQRIVKEHGVTQLVVLIPQQIDEGHQYLKKLGVEIEQVRQVSTDAIGLSGTPTLILVDSKGAVINSWVGKLPPSEEAEVLLKLE